MNHCEQCQVFSNAVTPSSNLTTCSKLQIYPMLLLFHLYDVRSWQTGTEQVGSSSEKEGALGYNNIFRFRTTSERLTSGREMKAKDTYEGEEMGVGGTWIYTWRPYKVKEKQSRGHRGGREMTKQAGKKTTCWSHCPTTGNKSAQCQWWWRKK